MTSLLSLFASNGPSIHVAPAEVLRIGGLSVTNSVLYGIICSILFCVLLVWAAKKVTIKPKGGVIQYVEAGTTFIVDLVESAFDNRETARKYVPFFVTLFFFILLSNWLGLLPIVGEGFNVNGHPIFRPMTGDLNATLAMGLVTMVVVYVASIREAGGLLKYIRHFFIGSPLNPLFLVIGLIEMLTDLTRVLSLSLRLFLNITIGEIVIAVFAYLGSVIAPVTALPFTLLELGVGALQAYIFVILGVNYLAISVNNTSSHSETEDSHELGASAIAPKEAVS